MRFFKNSELVHKYGVSDKTVRNWIAASLEGKLALKLFQENGKYFIADSVFNGVALKRIVENGKKYRNTLSHKTISPKKEFYDQFTQPQIVEICNQLEKSKEISWHYSYFGEAAAYWDTYLNELHETGGGNMITNTHDVLAVNYNYIDAHIRDYEYVNIINICAGNGLAAKDITAHIHAQGKLNRFVTIDISPDVLSIAANNMEKWFSGKIKAESHLLDLRHQWFGDALAVDPNGIESSKVINLVLFIAGPIVNFEFPQQPLRTIHDSLNMQDLLLTTHKRDTEETRTFFDFNIQSDKSLIGHRRKILVDLLNIDESYYSVEQALYSADKVSYIYMRLTVGITLQFKSGNYKKTISFEKGETLSLWRAWQFTDMDLLNLLHDTGFSLLQSSQSIDRQMLMTISKVKDSQDL